MRWNGYLTASDTPYMMRRMDIDKQHIGHQIRSERNRRAMTADALGQLIGRDRQAIYTWENGHRAPDGEAMLKLVQHGFVQVPTGDTGEAA